MTNLMEEKIYYIFEFFYYRDKKGATEEQLNRHIEEYLKYKTVCFVCNYLTVKDILETSYFTGRLNYGNGLYKITNKGKEYFNAIKDKIA